MLHDKETMTRPDITEMLHCCNCKKPAVIRGLCLWCARLFEVDGGMTDVEAERILRELPDPPKAQEK